MKTGFVSDIHANLEALEVALERLQGVDRLICVGDVVGYGPNPNECCEILRERNIPTVLGNHDAAVSGRMSHDWFNIFARAAVRWAQEILSDENRQFLLGLPLTYRTDELLVVHSSLHKPEGFMYTTSPWEARLSFSEMQSDELCLIGHTHVAEFYAQKTGTNRANSFDMTAGGSMELPPGFKYLINCGSVGQPRDGNPKGSAAILDTEARTLEMVRFEYPIETTQEKMRAAGLPDYLISRLEMGA